jgi:hypothetical protein
MGKGLMKYKNVTPAQSFKSRIGIDKASTSIFVNGRYSKNTFKL